MNRISPCSGVSFHLRAGQRLRLRDPRGQQVCDLFCFDADGSFAPLSSGRSIDYNETLLFSKGSLLYSSAGDVLLEIVHDTCGRHDFLVTPCSLQMFRMMAKNDAYHPSCLENLEKALQAHKIDPRWIGTTFNAFMNVAFDATGKIQVLPPLSRPGDEVIFLARRNLLVGLTACSDEGSNGGSCKEMEYEVLE